MARVERGIEAGTNGGRFDDAGDTTVGEAQGADTPSPDDLKKQRPGAGAPEREPRLERFDRAEAGIAGAVNADLLARSDRVGLGEPDQDLEAGLGDGDVAEVEGDEFGAAECGAEAGQHERALAGAARSAHNPKIVGMKAGANTIRPIEPIIGWILRTVWARLNPVAPASTARIRCDA